MTLAIDAPRGAWSAALGAALVIGSGLGCSGAEVGADTHDAHEVAATDAREVDTVDLDTAVTVDVAPEVDDPDTAATDAADAEVEAELPLWTPPDDPFDRGVVRFDIVMEPLARALLGQDPTSPVPAMCHFDDEAPVVCRVALAGNERTFRGLDGKASFAVRFDAPLHGLDGLSLDAQLGDASHLRTVVAHLVFRRLGLAAPRATLAQVGVDGEPFGLYAAVEPTTSPTFLERATGSADGAIFTASQATDFWPWQVPDLVLVRGDEARRAVLVELAERLEEFRIARLDGQPIPLADTLGQRVTMAPFLAAMAAELWLGHAGGYPRGIRDYSLYVAASGVVTFLPGRLGESLDPEDEPDPWWSGGRLLRHCMEDPACRPTWGKALDTMVKTLDDAHILGEASALAFRARRELVDDPRREASLEDVEAAQDVLLLTLTERSGWIATNLACTDPADVDHDGDGSSACVDDCDDDDPDVYPGAPERCNLRDDDCDGVLDDGGQCPTCLVVDDPTRPGDDPATWALCYAPRRWTDARDDCRAQGGDLVTVPSVEAHDALRRAAFGLDWTSWWIGLSDLDTEGTFVWSDGTPLDPDVARWSTNEPNNSGGNEDCVQLVPWSGASWNDLDCARQLPYVCALP